MGEGSVRYRGPKTWEIVPEEIKQSESLDIFKDSSEGQDDYTRIRHSSSKKCSKNIPTPSPNLFAETGDQRENKSAGEKRTL